MGTTSQAGRKSALVAGRRGIGEKSGEGGGAAGVETRSGSAYDGVTMANDRTLAFHQAMEFSDIAG